MPLKNCPYEVSWILTLTEVISIRILRMRLISAIMSFYWSHAIALQKLSNERSYKFSWILTLTEVISFRNLYIIKVQTDKSSYSIALRCELTRLLLYMIC